LNAGLSEGDAADEEEADEEAELPEETNVEKSI